MPPLLTQIARLSDGLPLVALMTPGPGLPVTTQDQQQAKQLVRKITHNTSGQSSKMSIENVDDGKTFCYMTRESLCFLVMTESKYPKRLAFLYLDEIYDLFLQQLVSEFGNNVRSGLSVSRVYIVVSAQIVGIRLVVFCCLCFFLVFWFPFAWCVFFLSVQDVLFFLLLRKLKLEVKKQQKHLLTPSLLPPFFFESTNLVKKNFGCCCCCCCFCFCLKSGVVKLTRRHVRSGSFITTQ